MKLVCKPLTWCPGQIAFAALILLLALTQPAPAAEISRFVGIYTGEAEIISTDGAKSRRSMNVDIGETKDGFRVKWKSTTHKPDGRIKEKSYSIDFVPSDRDGIYSAAMERNVFGHSVQLDPMKGEPFVWGRVSGETMTVFSLFVSDDGGYEMQQYDRTLAKGGLQLNFSVQSNGKEQRSVSTFLTRQ